MSVMVTTRINTLPDDADEDAIVPTLHALGTARQAAYGARPEHYPVIGAVALDAMAAIAGRPRPPTTSARGTRRSRSLRKRRSPERRMRNWRPLREHGRAEECGGHPASSASSEIIGERAGADSRDAMIRAEARQ
jgi:hypothetical protein